MRDVLRRHPKLWCDLAYRSDQASGREVDAAWRAVFDEFVRVKAQCGEPARDKSNQQSAHH